MTVKAVTDASFQADVLDVKDKYVLVDFWAEWCGPCRMLGPVIEAVGEKYANQLDTCKLNTDENANSAQTYQITGIPCVILFKDGKEVTRFIGFKPQEAFESDLTQHLK